jgi:hypothetical protein
MKTTGNKNSGTHIGSNSAVLKHSWAGLFPWHTNGKTVEAPMQPTQFQGIREFFSILRHDGRLLALLCSTVLTGLVLGGFFYMAAVTLLSRLVA